MRPTAWPTPTAANQIWLGDITYLPLASGGWAYLAAWRDAHSRAVMGLNVDERMTTDLCLTPCAAPWPCASHAFTQYLTEQKFVASCSRTGNPYDNALVESGWSTLKPELLPQQAVFEDVQLAREEIEYYLGTYYNSLRLHSAIGYRTPTQFEQQFTPPTQLSVFTRPPQLTAGRRALVLVGDVA